MTTSTLRRTLEELHLLRCSLLPGELLAFTEDAARWDSLLDAYALDPDCVDLPEGQPEAAPHFQVKLEGSSDVFFDMEIPYDPRDGGVEASIDARPRLPRVAARGDSLGRDEQERWQRVVSDALREVQAQDSEYPLYELISTHLLPELYASLDSRSSAAASTSTCGSTDSPSNSRARASESQPDSHGSPPALRYHALFVSHHLKSPQKRRALAQWAHALALSGFAKVGHPGVIYCEGAQDAVADFVDRVKSMQWLALRLRFIEPAPTPTPAASASTSSSSADRLGHRSEQGKGSQRKGWAEFEKVGEVVEEMRRLDREKFIVEMGIGSAGNPPTVK